jgi:hypothetical protein
VTVSAGNGNPFPAAYNGWQRLTSNSTAGPYFATDDFCTGQCWYDNEVYTPAGMPDTVYVIGSYVYGELPCNTKGVGCGNGRSNGRGVLYSDTAGDPDAAHNNRTFTDLTYDNQDNPANWCALAGISPCLRAPNAIHPDQHAIVVNPSNPTQIFEGSDGGVIRTDGTFADTSVQCTTERTLSAGAHWPASASCRGSRTGSPTSARARPDAAVHQRRHQPGTALRRRGRHAGQRDVVGARLRHQHAATDHLRRRRQRRLRLD